MPWFCTGGCGQRLGSPLCKRACIAKHGPVEAERIPPLDGFIELVPKGYSKTAKDEATARAIWFASKRKKEATRMNHDRTAQTGVER